jgi:hypothetical protein
MDASPLNSHRRKRFTKEFYRASANQLQQIPNLPKPSSPNANGGREFRPASQQFPQHQPFHLFESGKPTGTKTAPDKNPLPGDTPKK